MENTVTNNEETTQNLDATATATVASAPVKKTAKTKSVKAETSSSPKEAVSSPVGKTTKTKATTSPKAAATAPTEKEVKPKVTKKKVVATPEVDEAPVIVEAVAEEIKVEEKTPLQKGIEAGKATRKIIAKAGTKILGSSIQTTQELAGIYKEAGKKIVELGKEVFGETVKVVGKNQKTLRNASTKAFKETVETIKDSNLIENPLKKIKKAKK